MPASSTSEVPVDGLAGPGPAARALLVDRNGHVVGPGGGAESGRRSVASQYHGPPWHRLLGRRRPFQAMARDPDGQDVLLVGVPAVLGRELGAAWHLSVLPAGVAPIPLDDTDVLVVGHDRTGAFRYGTGVCEPVLGVPLRHLAHVHASTWSALALQVIATGASQATTTVHIGTGDGATLPTVVTCRQLAPDAFETTVRHRPTDQPAFLVARAMQAYGAADPSVALQALATALHGRMTAGTCLVTADGCHLVGTVPDELVRATTIAAADEGFRMVVGPAATRPAESAPAGNGPGTDQPPASGAAIGLAPRDPGDETATYVLGAVALLVEPSIRRVEEQRRDDDGLREQFHELLQQSLREDRGAAYVAHDLLRPIERVLRALEPLEDDATRQVAAELRDSLDAARSLLEPLRVGPPGSGGDATGESYDLDAMLASVAASFPGTRLRLGARDARATGSPVLARAAVRSLLENAHRHGRPGTVEVRSSTRPGRARVRITNQASSPLRPASLLPRQSSPSGRHGLGLPAVADLCHREGIEINVDSAGEGPFTIEVELAFPWEGSEA